MIRQAMQLCLRAQAALLGTLGLYVVLALASSTVTDKSGKLVTFSTALVLPVVLYLFTLPRYLRNKTQGGSPPGTAGAGVSAVPLVFSAALYLPLMILMSSDLHEWNWLLGPLPLFLALWLFCAYAYHWLREQRALVTAENAPFPRVLGRWLEITSRFLPSPVVLLSGAILLTRSLWAENNAFDLLKGRELWITAEYGLGNHISAARLFLGYFGRFVYGGSLLLAACTLVLLLVCRFSSARLRTSRAAAIVGLAVAFLAISSVTDYYFSWLSFLLDGELPAVDWILFILFFLHWTVPLLLVFAFTRASARAEQTVRLGLRTLVVFYAPLLLFDLAMTPFFADDFAFQFVLAAFLGLQLLSWGYLQAAFTPIHPDPVGTRSGPLGV